MCAFDFNTDKQKYKILVRIDKSKIPAGRQPHSDGETTLEL